MLERDFYTYLSSQLKKKGYTFNKDQCKDKINSLKQKYKEIEAHNKQTGADPQSCAHYEVSLKIFLLKFS